jgi:GH24 family phage-related lysozyme (muramidase)
MLDKLRAIFTEKTDSLSKSSRVDTTQKATPKAPVQMTSGQKVKNPAEITYGKEITDAQIERDKYIKKYPPRTHKVGSGDTLSKISKRYGVSLEALYSANPGFNKDTKLSLGHTVNIPTARLIVNVKHLSHVAKAMGLSEQFVKQWKKAEDAPNTPDNKFHNTPYIDKAGVKTIGIGHAIQNEKEQQEIIKKYGDLNLSNAEVCELFASDLLEAEENIAAIIGQKNYDKMPQPMKEALLDMVFNKGNAIIKDTEGLAWCLKNGKYEAAINKFTNIKSAETKQEMAGLAKRRLFDISIAIKMYKGKVPASNVATVQELYNKGVALLRKECAASGKNFNAQIVGYNESIQGYFGDKIQLKYITQ